MIFRKILKINLFWLGLWPLLMWGLKPSPVIIDTDMAIDDMQAIVYLLNSPEVDVRAITLETTGEATCKAGINNLLGILNLYPSRHIPIACGPDVTLSDSHHHFPLEWRSEADYNYFAKNYGSPKLPNVISLLQTTIEHSEQPLTIIAIGPETNLGLLLKHASIKVTKKIKQIFITGGNLIAKKSWNLYIDPKGANIVLHSNIPLFFNPLETQDQANTVIPQLIQSLQAENKQPKVYFILRLLTITDTTVADALTAILFVHPEIAQFTSQRVLIDPKTGSTHLDSNGVPVSFCVSIDTHKFKKQADYGFFRRKK